MPLSRMSRHLVHAVLASEDQKFFGHEGVDWDAVEKAIEEDRSGCRFARGGSTITQQLAKNLYFTTHRSLVRKLREVIVARWLEEELGKKRILELYLNVIEWGDGIYGAQAAAQRYYGKPASALDEVEAAGLAAMIPNPRRIHPRLNPQRHARAQRRVLWLMRERGLPEARDGRARRGAAAGGGRRRRAGARTRRRSRARPAAEATVAARDPPAEARAAIREPAPDPPRRRRPASQLRAGGDGEQRGAERRAHDAQRPPLEREDAAQDGVEDGHHAELGLRGGSARRPAPQQPADRSATPSASAPAAP